MRRQVARTARRRAGFTILEAVIAVALFSMLLGGFLLSVDRMGRAQDSSDVRYTLAVDALDAVRSITTEVRRTGYVTLAGDQMPVFFDDGAPGAAYAAFAHGALQSGESVREIVYRIPEDADADGWPDLDAGDEVVWEAVDRAIVCASLGDGTDALTLSTSDGGRTILARDVASIVFETPAQTGFDIPLDALRFTLRLRRSAADGTAYEFESQRVVRLRNGGFAP